MYWTLVTGGTGFLGRAIVEHLVASGRRVIVPTRCRTPADLDRAIGERWSASREAPRIRIVHDADLADGALREPRGWERALRAAGVCPGEIGAIVNAAAPVRGAHRELQRGVLIAESLVHLWRELRRDRRDVPLVHIGSVAEQAKPPFLTAYGRAKQAAARTLDRASGDLYRLVVGIVVGAGQMRLRREAPQLMRRLGRMPLWLEAPVSVAWRQDVARVVAAILGRGAALRRPDHGRVQGRFDVYFQNTEAPFGEVLRCLHPDQATTVLHRTRTWPRAVQRLWLRAYGCIVPRVVGAGSARRRLALFALIGSLPAGSPERDARNHHLIPVPPPGSGPGCGGGIAASLLGLPEPFHAEVDLKRRVLLVSCPRPLAEICESAGPGCDRSPAADSRPRILWGN